MREKVIMGLVLAFCAVLTLVIGDWMLFVAIMAGGAIGMWEYYRLIQIKKIKPMTYVGIIFGLSFILVAYLSKFPQFEIFRNSSGNIGTVVTIYVFIILVIQFWQIVQRHERYGMVDLASTVFGSLYIGAFGSFMFLIMGIADTQFPDSAVQNRLVLFLPMAGAWGSDVGAYFAGKFFGRNRIFPELSPKKTFEGCLGGIAYATFLFVIVGIFIKIPFGHAVLLGIVASIFGQIGDLVESAFKRELGVKDSGTLLGSHGGFLDRIDSFLFVLPVIYYYLVWFKPWG